MGTEPGSGDAGPFQLGDFMVTYSIYGWPKLLDSIRKSRIVFLSGDQGTGKTLFSVALGYHMKATGYVKYAAYNLPVSFSDYPHVRNDYIGVDEAGLLFDSRSSFKMNHISSFMTASIYNLRKRGSYIVAPSFVQVDKRLRDGTRIFRTGTIGKKLLWRYQWERGNEDAATRIEGGPKPDYWTGRFWLVNPAYFYGVYDTYYAPPIYHTLRFLEEASGLTMTELNGFMRAFAK